jgi:hypothetical protein
MSSLACTRSTASAVTSQPGRVGGVVLGGDRGQAGGNRDGGGGADVLGQLERRRQRAAGFGDAVDEAELMGAVRVELGPRDEQLLGYVNRQRAHRAEQGAGRRDYLAPTLGKREARRPRGHHQVAGERDLEAAAEGRALDRGDQGLVPAAPD